MKKKLLFLVIIFILNFTLSSCTTSTKQCAGPQAFRNDTSIQLKKKSFSQLDNWEKDNHLDSLMAFNKSCKAIRKRSPKDLFSKKIPQAGKNKVWQEACKAAEEIIYSSERKINYTKEKRNISRNSGEKIGIILEKNEEGKILFPKNIKIMAKRFWEENFTPYAVQHRNNKRGLVTGYFAIELQGSLRRHDRFVYPVYAAPNNLDKIKGKKHIISRKAIEDGSLANKGLEIAYVDDPARKYFLHVQGSGRILLDNGKTITLSYHKSNGIPYRCINSAITAYSKEKAGVGDTINVIKWLNKNPKIAQKIINHDPSYIFFRAHENTEFTGSQGVALTKRRTAAVDDRIYKYGMPIWINTTITAKHSVHKKPQKYSRMLISQDRGGAIKGSRRIDIFFGSGKNAENLASTMREEADFYLLLPK